MCRAAGLLLAALLCCKLSSSSSWALLSCALNLLEALDSAPCLCHSSLFLAVGYLWAVVHTVCFLLVPSAFQRLWLQIPTFIFSLSLLVTFEPPCALFATFLELSLLVLSAFLTLWLQLHCAVLILPWDILWLTWCPSINISWGPTTVLRLPTCFVFAPRMRMIIMSNANVQILL